MHNFRETGDDTMFTRTLTILTLVAAMLTLTACRTGPVIEEHTTTTTEHTSPPELLVE